MCQASCKVCCTYCHLILISFYFHNKLMRQELVYHESHFTDKEERLNKGNKWSNVRDGRLAAPGLNLN